MQLYQRSLERRGVRPRSVVQLVGRVRSFKRWMGPDRTLFDATPEDVETFLDRRRIGSRTRYGYLSVLHGFYEWAIEEGLTELDPTARIVRPKLRRSLPRPARTDDLARALEAGSAKQRAWVLLAALQGLRCQEIAGLRREDVNEQDGLLRVVEGKGGHERVLPLHAEVLAALELLPMPTRGWLFRRPMGGPYDPAQVSTEFNTFLRDIGVNATAHQLRHWFGTNLYNNTHDLVLVQQMLGHASPTTTTIYVAFDRTRAQSAIGDLSLEAGS